ncbi:MAG TPA: pitrilysin family protein [Burkholderiaceae bacterium]|jgi:predicted Zn-dependent peptidase|nr:pitrilysin family protein [Burkholderiaceae bacterium]
MTILRGAHRAETAGATGEQTRVSSLPNGVRVVTLRMPWLASASVSVFVRTGSGHESARENGISHVVEHMAFKGTATRDAARINIDAERLGAEVNAHTDKDHTAYHLRGMADDAGAFVGMLGDIVRHSVFPEGELERERQVILQEFLEDDEDPLSTAFRQFDKTCYGTHPLAQSVIGTRRNIERFTRADLLDYTQRQYTGANMIVAAAGRVEHDEIVRAAEAAFGAMPAGEAHTMTAPTWVGGVKAVRLAGCSQSHVVLGYPIATQKDDDPAASVAAALFGEGMSSPLMNEIREKRGLVYYAACSADVMETCGQFVIEASTTPDKVDELLGETRRLLGAHARHVGAFDLQRARKQIAVRRLRAQERPSRRVEDAALDLFMLGHVRAPEELRERMESVTAERVRETFERMLASTPTLAVAGKLGSLTADRLRELVLAPRAPARRTYGSRRPGLNH